MRCMPTALEFGQKSCAFRIIYRCGEGHNEAYRAMHNVTGGEAVKPFKM